MSNTGLKTLIRYIAQNVIGTLGVSLYVLADTLFISMVAGTRGLTALNLAIPVFGFVCGVGLMLGLGGGTRYSILIGQNKSESAKGIFSLSLLLGVFFSILFVIVALFLSDSLAILLGADQEMIFMTKTYLRVILIFGPAFIFENIVRVFVRNDGAPNLAMAAMVVGSFSNILMDYIFLFPLDMGIFGAALATGTSPVVGMIIMSYHWKKPTPLKLSFRHIEFKMWKAVIAIGMSGLIIEVSSGIVIFVFNRLILNISDNLSVAAYGVTANLSIVIMAIYNGIAQGAQPILSIQYGMKNKDGIRKTWSYLKKIIILTAVVTYVVIIIFRADIVSVFNKDQNPGFSIIAEEGLILFFSGILFMGYNIVYTIYLSSREKAKAAQAISLMRGILLIVPIAYIMAKLFGMTGIWIAQPTTELIVLIIGEFVMRKRV